MLSWEKQPHALACTQTLFKLECNMHNQKSSGFYYFGIFFSKLDNKGVTETGSVCMHTLEKYTGNYLHELDSSIRHLSIGLTNFKWSIIALNSSKLKEIPFNVGKRKRAHARERERRARRNI